MHVVRDININTAITVKSSYKNCANTNDDEYTTAISYVVVEHFMNLVWMLWTEGNSS